MYTEKWMSIVMIPLGKCLVFPPVVRQFFIKIFSLYFSVSESDARVQSQQFLLEINVTDLHSYFSWDTILTNNDAATPVYYIELK